MLVVDDHARAATSGASPKGIKSEKVALSEQQVTQLLTLLPPRTKGFYLTLLMTGIRPGECLGLKWGDVDFADKQLRIERQIYRGKETTPKTEISKRTRPMVGELAQALVHHKIMSHYTEPSDFVFASVSGRPMNPDNLRKTLQATLKRMGLSLPKHADGLHALRHTSGSIAYRRTGNLKIAQEWLGHSSARVTLDTYLHTGKDQQQATAASLAEGIFRPAEISPDPKAVH